MFSKSKSKAKKKNPAQHLDIPCDSFIAEDVKIKGNVSASEGIRIDGKVEGDITSEKGIVLGEAAVVTGFLSSKEVVIHGRLNGDVKAENLVIKKTGLVTGNVHVDVFFMERGGKYNGNLTMQNEDPAKDSGEQQEEAEE